MDEHKENTQIRWSCGIALLTLLLSENVFPGLAAKTVFLLLTMLAVTLYFKGHENGSRRLQDLSFVLAACLGLWFLVCAFFPDLPARLLDHSVQAPQEELTDALSAEDAYRMQQEDANRSLGELQDRVGGVSKGLEGLIDTLGSDVFLSEEIDSAEVQQLHDLLEERQGLIEEQFPDIKTKRTDLELFYKTKAYDWIYHYSSFISAFEDYGIDCDQLGVDRYTLMLWDTENLYILYSMKKELEPDLADNKWYESKGLKFDSNKSSKDQYSDLLDYGGWNFSYHNVYAEDLEKSHHEYVMNFYKRFHMNFAKAPV